MPLTPQSPINLNATQKVKDLLNYLYSISGTKTLSGMHNFFEAPNYWTDQVKIDFGDYPAVQGFEMGAIMGQNDATIASQRQAVVNAVINHANRGGICHMSWHQNYPFTAYDWNTGIWMGAKPQVEFDKVVTPGTAEYNWLIAEYDKAAPYFKQIRDANIPLIMRPYHEMNGDWFWWGHQPNYYKLWDIMYDRFTNVYGLNNLLWLWSANNPKNPNEYSYPTYFVGTNKCDILGVDIYLWVTVANAPAGEAPDMVRDHDPLAAISGGKPIVLSEIGHVISEAVLNTTRFAYFLEWGDYYRNAIRVWTGDTIAQNTATDRANMFTTSIVRNLNLSEVSITPASPPTPDTQAPTVPTNLAVSTKTTASIFLNWTASTDNVGVIGYDIYKNGTFLATVTTNSYNAVSLVSDTTYTFKVRAKDAAGNLSPFSTDLQAKTDIINTSFVRGINFAGGAVTIESQAWLAGNDATITYSANKLEYTNSPIITPSPSVDSPTSTMLNSNIYSSSGDFSVSQPLPNGSYQVYVWALENYQTNFRSFNLKLKGVQVTPSPIGQLPVNGWQKFGPYSVTVSDGVLNLDVVKVTGDPALHGMVIYTAGTNDTQPPTVPTSVTSPTKTGTSVSLSWTASTDNVGVTGYDVYEGANLKGTTATTSFTVTGLTASTAYSFTVKAKDAAGNISSASTPLAVTTNAAAADITPPTVPTNLASPAKTTTTVDLSWTASTDAVGVTGYEVYQNSTLVGTPTGTTYTATGLSPSVTYNFTVKAKDAAGNISASSSILSVTTNTPPDTQAPTVPTNLISQARTSTTVDLSWTASTDNVGVTGYDVYQGASLLGTTTGTIYTATGLTANTTSSFTVKAKDAANNISAASTSLSVTTLRGTRIHYTDNDISLTANSISATPLRVGQFAVVSGVTYVAIGTSSAADWKKISYNILLISDSFDGANSTTTTGGSWTAEVGTWGILSNKAYVSSNTNGALLRQNAGQANYTLTCLINGYGWTQATNISLPEIVVRHTDVNNYLVVYPYNGQLYLDKNDVGVSSNLAVTALTLTESTDHTIKVVTNGTNIKVYMDSVLKIDYTLAGANATKYVGTNVGMKLERASTPTTEAKWDDFVVTM